MHGGNSGVYECDVYPNIDWALPMNESVGAREQTVGRGLYYSPHIVRVVLMEPDEKDGDA